MSRHVERRDRGCDLRHRLGRNFVGVDLTHDSAPDATTLLKFRRVLEDNELTRRVFDEIKAHLASKGLTMREGTTS